MTQKIEQKRDSLTNEFNQTMKPVSLWADAWRRLRKNRMAFVGLIIIGLYIGLTWPHRSCPSTPTTSRSLPIRTCRLRSDPAGEVMLEDAHRLLQADHGGRGPDRVQR